VKSSTLTSWNSISVAGKIDLLDNVQRTCASLFGAEATCQAIERGTATLTFGLRRINDKVNITASGLGQSGLSSVLALNSAAEDAKCALHNSHGGTVVNSSSDGHFMVKVFGSAQFDTNSLDAATTWLSLPGGSLIPASQILYNQTFADPETGVHDQFIDAFVKYSSRQLAPNGITCEAFGGQSLTLVQQAVADLTVSGTTVVEGQDPEDFTVTAAALTSCEIAAVVFPCQGKGKKQ
jgi:hypothetical protein